MGMQFWDLSSLHRELLLLFREYRDICEKHGLRYFAMAGTALGAVRHGGFIPWDDDFDVMMPREDYAKFAKIAAKELPGWITYSRGGDGPLSPVEFARIWNNKDDIVQALSRVTNLQLKHPPFIDIFVLDGIPSYTWQLNGWWRKRRIHRLCQIYRYPETAAANTVAQWLKYFLCKIAGFFVSLCYQKTSSNDEMMDILDSIALENAFDASFMVVEPKFFKFKTRRVMPKNILEPAREIKFEDVTIKVPSNVDEYLKRIYGNYMTPPPKEQRLPDHAMGFSAGIPEWSHVE